MQENLEIKEKRHPFYKKLLRFFLWAFVLIVFFIGSLISLLFIYEDEVKSAIVAELNKHLKTEVKINPKNIDLTIIKTFPDCSVQFKNVLMLEALPIKKRDTLLFAGQLNLHFNIQNLWNKKYDIEKIKINNGVIKLQELKNGKNNYTFWESSSDTKNTSSDSLSFNLKLIAIENCRLSYNNHPNHFKTELQIQTLEFTGHFAETHFALITKTKAKIEYISAKKSTFLKNKNLDFAFELDVNENDYAFKKTSLRLNQLALELDGGFRYKDSLQNLKINYQALDMDIASVLSLLPSDLKTNINDYESSGIFYAKGQIKYSGEKSYALVSDFGIKQANITYKPQSAKANHVNLEGALRVSNSESELQLKNIFLNLNNDEIKGQCRIKDFLQPYLQISAQANVHLENLIRFFPIDTLTLLKGELKLNSEIEGLLADLKNETFSTKVKLGLNASVTGLQAQFKGDERMYSVENCSLIAQEREIEVKDLMLKRGSSDLKINGKIPGLFNHLLDHEFPLSINGTLFSNYLRMEDFMPKTFSATSSSNAPLIPKNIQLNLSAEIVKFNFVKFEAENISGNIEIKNQKAIISDMKFQSMNGEAEINAFADNSKNKLEIVLQSNLKNIDISELFSQLENFGQTTLQDKNIKGIASATVDLSGIWSNKLDADDNSIKAVSNINIERGELINFQPLLSLSKFVEVKDLQHIRFSTLQSSIQINNSLISIPKTSIKNSALNIDAWGTHSFNNDIDYHFQLLISELLAKKRKSKPDDEFGLVENDKENRRSAFIVMTGTVDNPIIKYDRKGLKEKIKTDIKNEKQNIRQILKEEFGLFKKDSANGNRKSEQVFELEKPTNNSPKKTLETKKKKEEDEDF